MQTSESKVAADATDNSFRLINRPPWNSHLSPPGTSDQANRCRNLVGGAACPPVWPRPACEESRGHEPERLRQFGPGERCTHALLQKETSKRCVQIPVRLEIKVTAAGVDLDQRAHCGPVLSTTRLRLSRRVSQVDILWPPSRWPFFGYENATPFLDRERN
jgi:hypothetical protein